MHADDTHLTYAGDNAEDIQLHLNQDLENVHNWLRANKLSLNMNKTEFMLLGSWQRQSTPSQNRRRLQLMTFKLARSLPQSHLELVTIDDKLDWSGHIEKVTKKVSSGIGAIRRIRLLVPQVTLHRRNVSRSDAATFFGEMWENFTK